MTFLALSLLDGICPEYLDAQSSEYASGYIISRASGYRDVLIKTPLFLSKQAVAGLCSG
jgi:hypothetical protein